MSRHISDEIETDRERPQFSQTVVVRYERGLLPRSGVPP